MDWIERLNKSIRYIEEHLKSEINYEELAKTACCSTYHFQRMFSYLAGISLSEYIRRRRMTLAAADLQSGEKIINVALNYGYSSPTAFNRAFQSVHGIAPSLVKMGGFLLKSYQPLHFQITVKGVNEMEYRIEKMDAFRIMGVSAKLHKEVEKNFKIVPKMWMKASMNGTVKKLASLMDGQPMGLLGVSACQEQEQWKYFIAVASSKPLVSSMEEYTIPAATWAVFYGEGTNKTIQELEKRIVTDWLPTSGYEYANAPDMEVYLNADPKHAKYEVWIPVIKKSESC